MLRKLTSTLALAVLAGACSQDVAAPAPSELVLAQESEIIAHQVGERTGATHGGWIGRLLDTLRTTDDPEALAFVAQAREYQELARAAREAGDFEAARRYMHLSFRALLSAVIEIYPNAPARTGIAVDEAIARIERYLGDRAAPRIRRVLAHVRELRNQADRALANGDPVTALAINLRAMEILHRLMHHLRDGIDHDREADGRMEGSVTLMP